MDKITTEKLIEDIHKNRDENSFTARLFEGILFPLFDNDNEFRKFIDLINTVTKNNNEFVKKKFNENTFVINSILPERLTYQTGLLFVESVDLFCNLRGEGSPDKTEFDSVILAEDENKNIHFIVFEVKCFSDLKYEEILRQQERLEQVFHNIGITIHHICLIGKENLDNAKSVFLIKSEDREKFKYGLSIVTWNDIYHEYLKNSKRFFKIEEKLSKKIAKSGKKICIRSLIK